MIMIIGICVSLYIRISIAQERTIQSAAYKQRVYSIDSVNDTLFNKNESTLVHEHDDVNYSSQEEMRISMALQT